MRKHAHKGEIDLLGRAIVPGFDVCHLPDGGFVEGVDAERAIELRADHAGGGFHEGVEHWSSIPIGGVRMTVGDDVIGGTVKFLAAPFFCKAGRDTSSAAR